MEPHEKAFGPNVDIPKIILIGDSLDVFSATQALAKQMDKEWVNCIELVVKDYAASNELEETIDGCERFVSNKQIIDPAYPASLAFEDCDVICGICSKSVLDALKETTENLSVMWVRSENPDKSSECELSADDANLVFDYTDENNFHIRVHDKDKERIFDRMRQNQEK